MTTGISFRCPDCHAPFATAEAVKKHRRALLGRCFHALRTVKQKRILRYRKLFDVPDPVQEGTP